MITYNMKEFLGRSTDKKFEDTTLYKVLDKLPTISKDGPWIGGGSIRRTLMKEEPSSDFDFFFTCEVQMKDFCDNLKTLSVDCKQHNQTEHHVHFKATFEDIKGEKDIQCIKFKYYQDIEDVLNSFDYTICQFVYDGENLYTGDYSLWDLARKRLAINKITYPVSTARRLLKYTNQGFIACNGCLNGIVTAVAKNPELNTDITYVD